MTYRVNPMVTHERLDDDVIAIHLETGMYYAFDGVAADCWAAVAAGTSVDEIADALVGRFALDGAAARSDVAEFVAGLTAEQLVVDATDPSADDVAAWVAAYANDARAITYTAPTVQRYDDLDDLLMLDPIHEVDDAGWPVARGD